MVALLITSHAFTESNYLLQKVLFWVKRNVKGIKPRLIQNFQINMLSLRCSWVLRNEFLWLEHILKLAVMLRWIARSGCVFRSDNPQVIRQYGGTKYSHHRTSLNINKPWLYKFGLRREVKRIPCKSCWLSFLMSNFKCIFDFWSF